MTNPPVYTSFLNTEAKKLGIHPETNKPEGLHLYYATIVAIQDQLFMQNLADMKIGFIKVIEADLRLINYRLNKLMQSNATLKSLDKSQEYLDEAYRKITNSLIYFQTPNEEPDNYRRINDRTMALQEARNALAKCYKQWPKQYRGG